LPDLEGTEVCRRIRQHSTAPIIILSARGGEADKVAVLDLGADDYVTKPFGPEELLARIRVALVGAASQEDRARPVTAALPC
jgi:DNA-binding response OmpR family regulator